MIRDLSCARASLENSRVHLIGIGGCGVRGAATVLAQLGATVSGSDRRQFEGMGELVARGVRVAIGHRAEQMPPDADLVIVSAAIPQDNPELAAARKQGTPVIKYAELLGRLMQTRLGVAIAGAHGKSTTTAMCAHIFRVAGLAPTFLIGAGSQQIGGSAALGSGPHLIVEACEYDRSFLQLRPSFAAILNIDSDHFDCYAKFDGLVEAFTQFARQVDGDGLLICNADDEWALAAAEGAAARVETFSIGDDADWRAVDLRADRSRHRFDVYYRRMRRMSIELGIAGRHNVGNALAAVALAEGAGVPPAAIAEALASFNGVRRRLTYCGKGRGVTIVDDYAHHPTEIRCTIRAAQGRYTPRRTWVVFQPHQYCRTRHLLDEFADSFGAADEVVVPDVYDARGHDSSEQLVGSPQLVERIIQRGVRVCYLPTLEEATEHVASHMTEGDLVLTMGAGDVWKVADGLVARLCG